MLTSTRGRLRNPASEPTSPGRAGDGRGAGGCAHSISIGPELRPLSAPPPSPAVRGKALWERSFHPMLYTCLVIVASVLVAPGCTGTRPPEPVTTAPASGGGAGRETTVTADWDDIYAATYISVPQVEGALTGRSTQGDLQVIRFITINDRPGALTAHRLGPQSDRPQPIRLEARIGYFGDPEKEDRLLAAIV